MGGAGQPVEADETFFGERRRPVVSAAARPPHKSRKAVVRR